MRIKKSRELTTVNNVNDIVCRNDVVIVKPIREEETNGILIPASMQEVGQKGIVCRVGPGIDDNKVEVEEGDKILYVKFAGSEISIEGEKFIVMKQEDILGYYNGDREIDIVPLENRVLLEWEFGRDEYIGTKILRSEGASKERYYTGNVIAVGPLVNEDIQPEKRVFFNQFCGPERIDFEGKRYAFIYDFDAYCILPLRKDITVLSH